MLTTFPFESVPRTRLTIQSTPVSASSESRASTIIVEILTCLTDDIIREVHGAFQIQGKDNFDKNIENDAFEGSPTIKIIRLIEDDNIVVAEGTVKSKMKTGGLMDAVFCEIFHFENGKIKPLSTYHINR